MDERVRSGGPAPSPDRVPTLTEVLELDEAQGLALGTAPEMAPQSPLAMDASNQPEPVWPSPSPPPMQQAEADASSAVTPPGASAPTSTPTSTPTPTPTPASTPVPVDQDTLVARVVEALLPSLDALLQERLLEALAPALERAAEQILRDSRLQLAATLQQCVQETVAQVLQPLAAPQG